MQEPFLLLYTMYKNQPSLKPVFSATDNPPSLAVYTDFTQRAPYRLLSMHGIPAAHDRGAGQHQTPTFSNPHLVNQVLDWPT